MQPKYSHITITLTEHDANAFSILGACTNAARRARLPQEEIDTFYLEATSGDYNHLIQTCMQWFNID